MYIYIYMHELVHMHMCLAFYCFLITLSWQFYLILTTTLPNRYDFPLTNEENKAQKDNETWSELLRKR